MFWEIVKGILCLLSATWMFWVPAICILCGYGINDEKW